ncbi:hypothetical protein BZA70DRAFT_269608 [Myxozyma melibiosi]|uniref:Uncharacterized protein n=1 Tax=Myxozyma melibiosi TaxID=54550 RepID=A0ABR1EZP0_9ASCO
MCRNLLSTCPDSGQLRLVSTVPCVNIPFCNSFEYVEIHRHQTSSLKPRATDSKLSRLSKKRRPFARSANKENETILAWLSSSSPSASLSSSDDLSTRSSPSPLGTSANSSLSSLSSLSSTDPTPTDRARELAVVLGQHQPKVKSVLGLSSVNTNQLCGLAIAAVTRNCGRKCRACSVVGGVGVDEQAVVDGVQQAGGCGRMGSTLICDADVAVNIGRPKCLNV